MTLFHTISFLCIHFYVIYFFSVCIVIIYKNISVVKQAKLALKSIFNFVFYYRLTIEIIAKLIQQIKQLCSNMNGY